MDWIVNNWYLIVAVIAVIAMGVTGVIKFFRLSRAEQIAKVKEWLKYAVTEAEKALGSGTGQLKLRYVYDMFVERFPWVARCISFDSFDELVNDALIWLNAQLDGNKNIKELVNEGK